MKIALPILTEVYFVLAEVVGTRVHRIDKYLIRAKSVHTTKHGKAGWAV